MKRNYTILFKSLCLLPVFLLLLLLLSDSCKNPTEDVKLIINFEPIKTYVNVEFVDASTGELIVEESRNDIHVIISGTNQDAVIDNIGQQHESYEIIDGTLSLGLNPNNPFVPTKDNPIRFNVVASSEGYISTSKSIYIISEGNYFVEISMVEINNPPVGVSIIEKTGVGELVDGQIQNEVIINTNNQKAQLIIPEGLVMKDASGVKLNGKLNILLAHFNNLEETSLTSFPGGLIASVTNNGLTEDGVFFSGGFAAIEISDESGRQANSFSNGTVNLLMQVPAETYNPETGTPVIVGDDIPLYSYAPETGEWAFEEILTIIEQRNVLGISANLTHLSYFNIDWFRAPTCDEGGIMWFTGDFELCSSVLIRAKTYKQSDGTYMASTYGYVSEGEPFTLIHVPDGIPVFIDWYSKIYDYYEVAPEADPTYVDDLCSDEEYTIPIVLRDENTQIEEIKIECSGYCANNPNVEIKPTFWFRYWPKGDYSKQKWRKMTNGKTYICGENLIGTEFTVGILLGIHFQYYDVTPTLGEYIYLEVDFPTDICNAL